MKKYVILNEELVVCEIIPEYNPAFPGVTVEDRYTKEYLQRALPVEESVEVKSGWEYLPGINLFVPPLESGLPSKITFESLEEDPVKTIIAENIALNSDNTGIYEVDNGILTIYPMNGLIEYTVVDSEYNRSTKRYIEVRVTPSLKGEDDKNVDKYMTLQSQIEYIAMMQGVDLYE